MRRAIAVGAAIVALAGFSVAPASATPAHPATSSNGPVGWDTYRRLDRLAEVPIGVQTKQFSSFDRTGGNGDFSRCLRTVPDGSCVLAEADGSGEIDSIWETRDGGNVTATGNLTIVLDGRTVLHAPFQDIVDGKLGAPFVYPVVANADQSSGGVYIIAPMPYRTSMLVYTDHDPIYYHVTYRTFPSADGVATFDPADRASDVIALLKASGTQDPKPAQPGARTQNTSFSLAPGASQQLASSHGPGDLSALRIRVPQLVAPPPPDNLNDDGRAFGANGSSQFTVKIDPANTGVRLTRRLDAGIGHQHAQILVDGQPVAEWAALPVSGACRWLDQSVDLPASATAGKSQLTIKNQFTSSDLDFNEFAYWADSTVNSRSTRTDIIDIGPSHTADETAHDYSITAQTWQGSNLFCYPETGGPSPEVLSSNDILANARVRVTVDGQRTVDAPLGQFFGSGQSDATVKALMTSMGQGLSNWFSAWWPMPYAAGITVSLYNGSQRAITSASSAVTTAFDPSAAVGLATNRVGYFRATSNSADTAPGADYLFLHTGGHGRFVGVSESMTGVGYRGYLEGDERVYIDGSHTPQLHGTGTEDFYEGGWYFNRDTFTDPVNGEPSHLGSAGGCPDGKDCTSTYRLMLGDAVSFESGITFGIEHGGVDDEPAHYSSTAFWYGSPSTNRARQTDAITVGGTPLTSTYEGNNGPAQPLTDNVGSTTTPVSYRVTLDPANHGAVLRRTSDQATAGQQAAVSVDGKAAGTWLEPLSNSNHRWLDDTFTLPAALTAGHRSVTVTLTPVGTWTASRYVVQSLVAPFADRHAPTAPRDVKASAGNSNAITVQWAPASDDVGVDHYEVYGWNGSAAPKLLGRPELPTFQHTGLGLREAWHYRVMAVDGAGHRSTQSATASATTGTTLRVEAESLLPAFEATAPVEAQGNCCGISWSGSGQLWFRPADAPQHVTLTFTVPTAGLYSATSVQTLAPDYGITTLAIDGTPIGSPVDGYHAGGVVITPPADDGQLQLAGGAHTLTLTVTGKNAASANYLAGLDYLELQLA